MVKKQDFAYFVAAELKKRDNPKDFKPCEAIVISLSPLTLSVLDSKVILIENQNLIISEWFKKRWDLDKTTALSADVPSLLASAKAVSETHSYTGSPCIMPSAITHLANAIAKVNTELLQLKLNLQIHDKVIIIPSSQADIFFLVDKVLEV